MALDPLYRLVDQEQRLRGITLTASDHEVSLKIAGYADDSAMYLASPAEISVALDHLRLFVTVSGLNIDVAKSTVLQLGATEVSAQDMHGLTMLEETGHCHYLGILVGRDSVHDRNWELSLRATTARFALAVAKTHTVAQRIAIANAVIIPKIVYFARHVWPSRAMVERLPRTIQQFVWGSQNGRPRKA